MSRTRADLLASYRSYLALQRDLSAHTVRAYLVDINDLLSFLGVGLPPTEPSLGMLIANGFPYMLSGRYWISIYPGIALILLIFSVNLVGDQIRDQLNPRLKR